MGQRISIATWCFIVFLTGFTMRGVLALSEGKHKEQFLPAETVLVAKSISESGLFGNPFSLPTGATAHVPPAYPYVLAAVGKATGFGSAFPLALLFIAILGSSLLWALTPLAAVTLQLPRGAAITAGFLGALNPIRHWVELDGQWETPWAAIGLLMAVAVTFRLCLSSASDWEIPRRASVVGIAWGLLTLVNPACTPVFFGLLAVCALRRRTLLPAFYAIVLWVVVLTPWSVRNYTTFGKIYLVRSNFGLELSISNQNDAEPHIQQNLLLVAKPRHPHTNKTEAAIIQRMGEPAYNEARMREAVAWIRENPTRFATLTFQRFVYFWLPQRASLPLRLAEFAVTSLAAVGLALIFRANTITGVVLATIWTVYPLIYYIIQSSERYRYPIEWTFTMCAAYAIYVGYKKLQQAGSRLSATCGPVRTARWSPDSREQ